MEAAQQKHTFGPSWPGWGFLSFYYYISENDFILKTSGFTISCLSSRTLVVSPEAVVQTSQDFHSQYPAESRNDVFKENKLNWLLRGALNSSRVQHWFHQLWSWDNLQFKDTKKKLILRFQQRNEAYLNICSTFFQKKIFTKTNKVCQVLKVAWRKNSSLGRKKKVFCGLLRQTQSKVNGCLSGSNHKRCWKYYKV